MPLFNREAERAANELRDRPVVGADFEHQMKVAERYAMTVDAVGKYQPSHTHGVSQLCRSIAEHMGIFSSGHISRIELAGLWHDAGKLRIPDSILFKPGPLTVDEGRVMKQHAEFGQDFMLCRGYGDEARWVYLHHEWWDGTGYPDGLVGAQIPIEARIISIADARHAMTSSRPYRETPRTAEWAMGELERMSGIQFCPDVVRAILAMPTTR
jgi:HD-GYP domain-containing protein (c-di-GMP phosphodiesterase class II)